MAIIQMKEEVEFKLILVLLRKMLFQKAIMDQVKLFQIVSHFKRNRQAQVIMLSQVLQHIAHKVSQVFQEDRTSSKVQANLTTKTNKE